MGLRNRRSLRDVDRQHVAMGNPGCGNAGRIPPARPAQNGQSRCGNKYPAVVTVKSPTDVVTCAAANATVKPPCTADGDVTVNVSVVVPAPVPSVTVGLSIVSVSTSSFVMVPVPTA